MINQLMAMLLPSIIGIRKFERLNGEIKGIRRIIEEYLKMILLTNLISYLITIYIFKNEYFIFSYPFTAKYIILSVVISYMLPVIEKIVNDNLKIEIVVEKNEKKN